MGTIISQEIPYSGVTLSQQSQPIGMISAISGTTVPSGYLACDGTVYSISLYPHLAAYYELEFGACNKYGGDGVTTFAVPDLCGEYIRGCGTNHHTGQGNGGMPGEHQDATQLPNIFSDTTNSINWFNTSGRPAKTDAQSSVASQAAYVSKSGTYTVTTDKGIYTSRPTTTSFIYVVKAKPDRLDKITFAEVDDTSVSSDAVWSAEKIQGILDTICAPNAGAHNGIFRGKNLGSGVTSAQYDAIDAGTFDDLFIGDYWTIGGVNYRIAAFDYWLHSGNTECTKHHVVIVPDEILYEAKMNDTDTTSGGYTGSKMRTTNLASAVSTINSAFPNHVLTHREYLVNTVSNGNPSGGAWFDSAVELPNECMIYGSYIFTPGVLSGTIPTRNTINKSQLALFALRPDLIVAKNTSGTRKTSWFRDPISSADFSAMSDTGNMGFGHASNSLGVRPVFGIYKA